MPRGSRAKATQLFLRKGNGIISFSPAPWSGKRVESKLAGSRDRAIFDCEGIRRSSRKNITPLGTSLAPLAQMSIYLNIIFFVLFRSCFTHEYRLPIGKYRAALRHITCAFCANIDLRKYPLIHRRRDGGPPSPRRFLQNRGKVGRKKGACATAVFILGRAERAKVGTGGESRRMARRLSFYTKIFRSLMSEK